MDTAQWRFEMVITEQMRRKILSYQKREITEHYIYRKLADGVNTSASNRRILKNIAGDEYRHYTLWRKYTQQDVKPNKLLVWGYYILGRVFGFTFAVKLLEKWEENNRRGYQHLIKAIPFVESMIPDEFEHETTLLKLLDEDKIRYTGSMVLGLNDALVELTGALAGLTFALQNTKLIALTGLITGISAALSMAASEYLSTKSEETIKKPTRASLYTGGAYLVTVVLLITPYLMLNSYYIALGISLITAVIIIALFNYYLTVVKGGTFKKRFIEMAGLSLTIAALSFVIGLLMRHVLGIEI
jgi:VIT1/CCC1 family predicted Fe2+/Mn2+ transporter